MQLFKMFGEVALKGGKAVTNQLKVIDLAAARTARGLEAIPDKVETEVDVDTDKAENRIGSLMGRLGAMQRGIMALGPAVVPVMASLTSSVGGFGAGFVAAGAGVASFAAIAIPALSGVFEASKEVDKINEKLAKADTAKERAKALKELKAVYGGLTAKERESLTALQDFKSFWDGFVKSLQNPILDMFIKGLGTLKNTLNQLKPVFQASISAVGDLFNGMDNAVKGQQMQTFFDWLGKNVGPAIRSFGTAFMNVMQGVINLIMAFGPISTDMQSGLVGLTQKFADWTAGLANSQGFKDFIAYVQANGPKLMAILGEVATLIGQVIKAMAPFGPVILDIVSGLLQFVNWLLQLHPAVGVVLVGILQLVGVFKLVSGGITSLLSAFNFLKNGAQTTGTVFKNIGTGLKAFGTTVLTALRIGFTNAIVGIRLFGSSLSSLASGALNALRVGFTGLMNGIRLLGPIIQSLVTGALRMLVSGLRSVITVFNLLRMAMMANPFIAIITAVVLLVAIIIFNWDIIKAYLLPIWNSLKSAAASIFNELKSAITSAVSTATNFLQSAWNTAKSRVSSIWNELRSTAISVFNTILNGVSNAVNATYNTINNIWSSIRSVTSSVWNSIKNTIRNGIKGAYNTVRGYASSFLNAGKSLLDSLAQGIRNGLSKAIIAVKNGMKEIRSYLPFSPAKEGPLSDLDQSGKSFFPTFASKMHHGLTPALSKVGRGMERIRGLADGNLVRGSLNNKMGASSVLGTMGGGIQIHFHAPVSIRSEEDIRKLVKEIEQRLYRRYERKSRNI